MYQILNLPDYMKGLWGIKTPNDDKHSDATDLEFLCFDISHKAMVYVLYDTRARDQPTWLKSGFKDQDLQVVSHTDVGMGGGSASGGNVDIRWDPNYGAGQVANQQTAGGGHMETFYAVHEPGRVCLGGNDAPGVGSNYMVLVGPMHDLGRHPVSPATVGPSHRSHVVV